MRQNFVRAACLQHLRERSLLPGRAWERIVRFLDAMPGRMRVHRPVEAITPLRLNVSEYAVKDGIELGAHVLCFQGWDLATALHVYRNFRTLHPRHPYNPEVYRLMPRSALRELFGHVYGDFVADMFVTPNRQPIFNAIMQGRFDTSVVREFCAAHVVVQIPLHDRSSAKGEVHWEVDEPQPLTRSEGQRLYEGQFPGHTLDCDVSLSHIENDYEAILAAEDEVRQADPPD